MANFETIFKYNHVSYAELTDSNEKKRLGAIIAGIKENKELEKIIATFTDREFNVIHYEGQSHWATDCNSDLPPDLVSKIQSVILNLKDVH